MKYIVDYFMFFCDVQPQIYKVYKTRLVKRSSKNPKLLKWLCFVNLCVLLFILYEEEGLHCVKSPWKQEPRDQLGDV